jgi:hypothetical protein
MKNREGRSYLGKSSGVRMRIGRRQDFGLPNKKSATARSALKKAMKNIVDRSS